MPVLITQQPQNQAALAGTTANFSVTVSGIGPFSYQWRKDGTDISGPTGSVYTISNAQTNDVGSYSVIIANAYGSVTSSNAVLAVVPTRPVIPGVVVGWGSNDQGESMAPSGLNDAIAIAATGYHSLALKADGTVVAWGRNYDGQSTVPVGLTGVVAIAAGYAHSLALKSGGTIVAWGSDEYGERTVPGELTSVVAIAGGDGHSLALKSDGTVVAWGRNDIGQSTVPSGLNGVVAIAAGYNHSLALIATPPALVVQASGNNILLSWPLWAQGFAMQSTTKLADTNSWTTLTNLPVIVGSHSQVTDAISGPARFYRLKK